MYQLQSQKPALMITASTWSPGAVWIIHCGGMTRTNFVTHYKHESLLSKRLLKYFTIKIKPVNCRLGGYIDYFDGLKTTVTSTAVHAMVEWGTPLMVDETVNQLNDEIEVTVIFLFNGRSRFISASPIRLYNGEVGYIRLNIMIIFLFIYQSFLATILELQNFAVCVKLCLEQNQVNSFCAWKRWWKWVFNHRNSNLYSTRLSNNGKTVTSCQHGCQQVSHFKAVKLVSANLIQWIVNATNAQSRVNIHCYFNQV